MIKLSMGMDGLIHGAQIYNWAQVLAAVIAFSCALAAYITPGDIAGKFRVFMLAVMFWAITITHLRMAPDHDTAYWAARGFGASLMFLAYSFLDFVNTLLGPADKRDRRIMRIYLGLLLILFCMLPTDLIVSGLHHEFWGWSTTPGKLYFLFFGTGTSMLLLAFRRIFRRYPLLGPIEKNRLRFLIVSIGLFSASVLSYLFTMLGIAFPYGAIGSAIAMIMMSYAALRNRIVDFPYFTGKLLAGGIHCTAGVIAAVVAAWLLNSLPDFSPPGWLVETMPYGVAVMTGAAMVILFPIGRLQKALLKKLAPEKADLYKTLEEIAPRIAYSRQPERWMDEIENILGGVSPLFVPFDDRFPHPCPPMEELHPLRRTLSARRKPVNVKTPSKVNPCPAFDVVPSRRDEGWLAIPVFDGKQALGALVFGPELAEKLYSTNDIRKLQKLAEIMGRRLADPAPAAGLARVVSWSQGIPVVIDEEQFDTIEDLKASEFFHFYLPHGDASIEIIFESRGKVEKVC